MWLQGALLALVLSEREAYVGFRCFGRGQNMRFQGALHALVLSEREASKGFTCFDIRRSLCIS